MTDQPDAWHAKIRQIFEYWQRIHPAPGVLPGRQHFDPLAVAPLLPNVRLIEVHRAPLRFRYRLVGTRVFDAHDYDMTGKWLDEVHPEFGADSALYREYVSVMEERRPRRRRGEPIFRATADKYAEIERILLPFAQDGTTVDLLLALSIFLNRQGEEV